jgi:hypothetical protein
MNPAENEATVQLEAVLKADHLFVLGAKLAKKSVEALVNQGFTRSEAVQIVAAQGSLVKGSN